MRPDMTHDPERLFQFDLAMYLGLPAVTDELRRFTAEELAAWHAHLDIPDDRK